ncbi:MAG: hypothetical protein KZQ93_21260, partial [Candidatus Thiodiazotropha sp. (ex Monitilora ramsayi)]|nr:hypothetical protein [Candidatus Thiodiazotropha sp. (ex Monitilora ramsayi)]
MFNGYEVILIAVLGTQLVLQLALLFFIAWLTWLFCRTVFGGLRRCFRQACRLVYRETMDCDELIDGLLSEHDAVPAAASGERVVPDQEEPSRPALHRERLAALVAGGQARQCLGKAFTVDQIDALDDAEVEKLYARYEA